MTVTNKTEESEIRNKARATLIKNCREDREFLEFIIDIYMSDFSLNQCIETIENGGVEVTLVDEEESDPVADPPEENG